MATPRNRVPDPRETFGFGSRPLLTDYFQAPVGAASNPAFSPAARSLFAAEDQYRADQLAAERDAAAGREGDLILDTAPTMSDEGIRDWLLENPRVLNTEQGRQVQNYLQARNEAKKMRPQSDMDLGVSFAESIEDPGLRAGFQGYMTQGLPFSEARDRYFIDRNNQQQAMKLAEAGIGEDRLLEVTESNGRINPVAVARMIAQEKQRQQGGGEDTVLDRQIDTLRDAVRARTYTLEKQGADLMADPQLAEWNAKLTDMYSRRLGQFEQPAATPSGVPTIGTTGLPQLPEGMQQAPAAPAPAQAQAPAPQRRPEQQVAALEALQQGLTLEEYREKQAELEAGAAERVAVDQAWTDAKLKANAEIAAAVADPVERALVARAIIAGRDIPGSGIPTDMGEIDRKPYWTQFIKDPNTLAFKEPGNLRTGSQNVEASEVLQAWARDYLSALGLLGTPGAQPPPQSEKQKKADEIIARQRESKK